MPRVDPAPRCSVATVEATTLTEPSVSAVVSSPTLNGRTVLPKMAVALEHVERLDMGIRHQLLTSKLDLQAGIIKGVFNVVDGVPLEVPCFAFRTDTVELLLTAAMACDVLRDMERDRGEPVPTTVWIKKDKVWVRLPWNAMLTVSVRKPGISDEQFDRADPKCWERRLNPDVFGAAAKIGEELPPAEALPPCEVGEQIVVRKWGAGCQK